MTILTELGIFGWKEADENLLLASLLTGDPLLLIGNHGCAKTHVANKIAQALGRRFLAYDASKAMFEDILGFLVRWVPHYKDANRGYLTVAVGCTGGQHRSVYMTEKLAAALRKHHEPVLTRHNNLPEHRLRPD